MTKKRTTLKQTIEFAASHARRKGLVIMAGAGVSMDEPASMPGWYEVNDMIVDALCERVTTDLDRTGWFDEIRENVRFRRDEAHIFPPEYQAQIIEEQCGETYFQALQSLDSPQRNFCHEAIAALAEAGLLRAIVTTNFDRLIELSLTERGIHFRTYIDESQFRDFAASIKNGSRFLPIIKLHGSVEEARSLIDTLKQRLRGRERALVSALKNLLKGYHWIYAGFSADDLSYDPNYLGIADAAAASPGCTFLRYPGSKLTKGARHLKKCYGDSGLFLQCTLRKYFSSLLKKLYIEQPPEPGVVEPNPKQKVRERIAAWAKGLNTFEAMNITSSLFETAGEEHTAFQMLHKTWGSWMRTGSPEGIHYAQYQFNYARLCLASGELTYEETPQNFLRPIATHNFPEAYAPMALFWFWRGDIELYASYIDCAFKETKHNPEWHADALMIHGRVSDLYYQIEAGLAASLQAAEMMQKAGDHPRFARARALSCHLFGRGGEYKSALGHFNEGEAIARRLGDETALAELYYGRGVAGLIKEKYSKSFDDLKNAENLFRRNHRWPMLIGVWIEQAYTAYILDIGDAANAYLKLIEDNIDRFQVWLPIYYSNLAILYALSGESDKIRSTLRDGLEYATRLKNKVVESDIRMKLEKL